MINFSNPITRKLLFDSLFIEGGGSSIYESLSKTYATITASGATWSKDFMGKVLDFSAQASNVVYKTTTNQNNVHQITTESLIYMRGYGANNFGQYFHKGGTNSTVDKFLTHEFDSGVPNKIRIAAGFSTSQGVWDIPFTLNQWNHVVITYDDSSASNQPVVYINGVKQSVSTTVGASGTRVTDTTLLNIGNDSSGGTHSFDGKIAYLRYWGRILNNHEARLLYSNPWQIYYKPSFLQSLNQIAAVGGNVIAGFRNLLGVGQ